MEQEFDTVSDFNMNLIVDFFKGVERQGPGCATSTRRAIDLLPPMSADQTILDIGCGTGKQTDILAAETEAHIIASDLSAEMLEMLRMRLAPYGSRIETLTASMDALTLPDESVDTIWSEGSVFIVGFRNGLKMWRRMLREGGYIVVSDAAWITPSHPDEIDRYWLANYPDMTTVSNNIAIMEQEGYAPVAHFVLPEGGWTENYYVPMARRIEQFAAQHAGNPVVEEFLGHLREEIETYNRFKEYYSYVFYIGRKAGK